MDGNPLQGPSSLHLQDREESTDFVVITGQSSFADETEPDLFSSLSQADAVAQIKELMNTRDGLQKSFTECTAKLSEMTKRCEEQKQQERVKCNQAKKKISSLEEEKKLQQQEIVRLTTELSKISMTASSLAKLDVVGDGQDDITYPQVCTSERLGDHMDNDAVPASSTQENELKERLEKKDKKISELSTELYDLKRELSRHASESNMRETELKSKIRTLDEQLGNLANAKSDIEDKYNALKSDKNKLVEEKMALDQTIENLQGVNKGLLGKITACTSTLKDYVNMKKENGVLKNEIQDLNGRISTLSRSVGDDLPALVTENDSLREQIGAAKEEAERRERSFQDRLNRVEHEKNRLIKQNSELNELVTNLKQQLANSQGDNERLGQQLGELNSHNIRQTVVTNGPRNVSPVGGPATPQPPLNTAMGALVSCPFQCGKTGDSDFIGLHIERDHPWA